MKLQGPEPTFPWAAPPQELEGTGHCYVISFGAGKRLDVIITIMKLAMFCFMSPQVSKRWGQKIIPQPSKRGAALALFQVFHTLPLTPYLSLDNSIFRVYWQVYP